MIAWLKDMQQVQLTRMPRVLSSWITASSSQPIGTFTLRPSYSPNSATNSLACFTIALGSALKTSTLKGILRRSVRTT